MKAIVFDDAALVKGAKGAFDQTANRSLNARLLHFFVRTALLPAGVRRKATNGVRKESAQAFLTPVVLNPR